MATKKAAKGAAKSASKSPVKKSAAKKKANRDISSKAPVKKAAERAPAKKAVNKRGGRSYSPAASKNVEREMKEMQDGKLTVGRSGKKVTNPKQAIAIGLAEARRAGEKVPANPNE